MHPHRCARAIRVNVRAGQIEQGGSTLTSLPCAALVALHLRVRDVILHKLAE
jgi:hypothetical protein